MKSWTVKIVLNLIWFLGSCAPLFSDLQGARLVGKRQFELTPGYSSVGSSHDDDDYGNNNVNFLGFQAAYGLSEKVDLRVRYEHSWVRSQYAGEFDDGMSFEVMAVGPKIELAKDRSALYLPVVLMGGSLFQFQPTFLFTIPVVPNQFDINPSVKHIADICRACWEPLIAFNLGIALSSDIRKWAIRSEYGVLYDLGSPGHFTNLSVGLSLNMSVFKSR